MAEHIRKRLESLTAKLGQASGLPGLALNEAGSCSLSLDGRVYTLHYYEAGETLYCIHNLGNLPAPAEERLRIALWLLERNCFFRGVGPGVLGVSEGSIYYCARLDPVELEYLELETFTLAVADICAALGQDLTAFVTTGSAEVAPLSIMEQSGMIRI